MNGFENEFNFVLELNNKLVGRLNILLHDFVYDLFDNNIENMYINSHV